MLRSVIRRSQYIFLSFFLALTTASVFQNCSRDYNFSSIEKISKSLQTNENGTPFLGKPEEGDYVRTDFSKDCASGSTTQIGASTISANNINITQDICETTNLQIPLSTPLLNYQSYNPDYFGLLSAIFEKKKLDISEPPVTETWCSSVSTKFGIDVVLKTSSRDQPALTKIYIGNRFSPYSEWTAKKIKPFLSDRFVDSSIRYTGNSFSLNVIPTSSNQSTSTGQLVANIDGASYDLSMACRTAVTIPIVPTLQTMYVGIPIDTSLLTYDRGFAYWLYLTTGTSADNFSFPTQSTLRIFENGVEIGPAHTDYADIINLGAGRFVHWSNTNGSKESIALSSSDNSNPKTNGRVYTYTLK